MFQSVVQLREGLAGSNQAFRMIDDTIFDSRDNSLQFYERIIRTSPKLLTQTDYYKTPHPLVQYPRLVLEIGDDTQALMVAKMMEYYFEPHIYLDAYGRARWVVGFEPVHSIH